MSKKSLAKYITPKKKTVRLGSIRVDKELRADADVIRAHLEISWSTLVNGLLHQLVDDNKPKLEELNDDNKRQMNFLDRVDVERAARIFTAPTTHEQARFGSSPR